MKTTACPSRSLPRTAENAELNQDEVRAIFGLEHEPQQQQMPWEKRKLAVPNGEHPA